VQPLLGKHVLLCGFVTRKGHSQADPKPKLSKALEYMGAIVEHVFQADKCEVLVAPNGWGEDGFDAGAGNWVELARESGKWTVCEDWVWACVAAGKCVSGQDFLLARRSPRSDDDEEDDRKLSEITRVMSRLPRTYHT
jgi:hypothetical protein